MRHSQTHFLCVAYVYNVESVAYQDTTTTGIPGLDSVLNGGLPKDGIYLIQGNPGVGKTTFALQFLLEGVRLGERALYVSFSETKPELLGVARSHGWSLDGVELYDLRAAGERVARQAEQTMFHPAEVELDETTAPILDEIRRLRPTRVAIDSVSEIRLLARDAMRYRRQMLALKQFFLEQGCTVMLVDDKVALRDDDVVQTVVHGIIALEKLTPVYGASRRRLRIEKLRGVRFREGFHDYRIQTGGLVVFPRLVAAEHAREFPQEPTSTGVQHLDRLLGGGLDRGTSTLVMGAAGAGKSSLITHCALTAAARGERAVVIAFEESFNTWSARTKSLGWDLDPLLASKNIKFLQVDPAELTPGELSSIMRDFVEREQRTVVAIDSINGYLQSVPEENYLLLHMHELLTYLGQQGVTTLMVVAQQGILGNTMSTPIDITYLADAVLLLRYFEAEGRVRQAISVLKKRSGKAERSIREFTLSSEGISVGEPLTEFHGVLTGVPNYHGQSSKLRPGIE